MFRSISIPRSLSRRPGPLAAGLLLLLAMGAAPAHATGGLINTPQTIYSPITVGSGETLTVVAGGSVNTIAGFPAIIVQAGGSLNITGGSVSDSDDTIQVQGGTVMISGGSVSGNIALGVGSGAVTITGGSVSGVSVGVGVGGGTVSISGGSVFGGGNALQIAGGSVSVSGGSVSGDNDVVIGGGTVNISGGSFSSNFYGVWASGGTVAIFGCGWELDASGQLTGLLQDGTPINASTRGLGPGSLMNGCATVLANVIGRVVSDPGVVQALLAKLNAIVTAPNGNARAGAVGAFINQVNAQTGKSITPANAALLIQLVSAV